MRKYLAYSDDASYCQEEIVATINTLICLQENVWKEEGRKEKDRKTFVNFDIDKRDCKL